MGQKFSTKGVFEDKLYNPMVDHIICPPFH